MNLYFSIDQGVRGSEIDVRTASHRVDKLLNSNIIGQDLEVLLDYNLPREQTGPEEQFSD